MSRSLGTHGTSRGLVVAVAVSYLATVYGGGRLKEDFSHLSDYVSELNATGTAWAWQIGAFGFVPFGLLAFALLCAVAPHAPVARTSRLGYWLLAAEPVAWIGSTLAPCDPGCPIEGSLSQNIHNLLGGTTYLVTALGLVLLSRSPLIPPKARKGWLTLAAVWLVLFALMLLPELASWRGLFQRLAEVLIYGCLCAAAWRLPHRRRGPIGWSGTSSGQVDRKPPTDTAHPKPMRYASSRRGDTCRRSR